MSRQRGETAPGHSDPPAARVQHATSPCEVRLPYCKPVLREFGSVADLTMGRAGSGTDFSMMTRRGSDRRLKENVVRVGEHPAGFALYLFDYKPRFRDLWGHGRQCGAMADEVERVAPHAVSVGADGYCIVDYARLARA